MVSLVTLTFALLVRSGAVSIGALSPYLNEIFGLVAGGVVSAFCGARLVNAVKSELLIKTIAALLAALGALILFEVIFHSNTCKFCRPLPQFTSQRGLLSGPVLGSLAAFSA